MSITRMRVCEAIMQCQQSRRKIGEFLKYGTHAEASGLTHAFLLEAACIFMIRVRLINKENGKMKMQMQKHQCCWNCVNNACLPVSHVYL